MQPFEELLLVRLPLHRLRIVVIDIDFISHIFG
jgi:hypothetical protein